MDSLIRKNLQLHPDDKTKIKPECETIKYGRIPPDFSVKARHLTSISTAINFQFFP